MSTAYKCDGCGAFGEGNGYTLVSSMRVLERRLKMLSLYDWCNYRVEVNFESSPGATSICPNCFGQLLIDAGEELVKKGRAFQ